MAELDVSWRSLLLFGLSLPTLAAAFFIATRSADRPAAFWLAGLLFAWVLLTVPYIIGFAGAYGRYPWLTFAPFNTELWIGPLIYCYVSALVKAPPPGRIWLIPGIVQSVYYTACFLLLGSAERKFAFSASFHEPYVVPLETVLGLALGAAGVWLAYRRMRAYRQQLVAIHSAADRFDPAWLAQFMAMAVSSVVIWIAFDIVGALKGGLSYIDNYWLFVAIGMIFLWLAFEAVSRSALVFPAVSPAAELESDRPGASLDLGAVRKSIVVAGWHRDENLTVGKLARHLGTNQRYLSRAINSEGGENFNLFINRIRVEEVCRRIEESDGDVGLLDLALEAGFASKATFNRAFKAVRGVTPSQWRRGTGIKS